jgi:hypothetical protein
MNEENKKLIQETIDRLLYCKGFKEELQHVIAHYDPHTQKVFTNDIKDFKWDLSKAI